MPFRHEKGGRGKLAVSGAHLLTEYPVRGDDFVCLLIFHLQPRDSLKYLLNRPISIYLRVHVSMFLKHADLPVMC